jgi:DNA-directed RNA polymerase II subunit RPB3
MNPVLKNISEENDILNFTLSNINVSLANAIRRTILSDIKSVVLGTDIYKDDKCKIKINTCRLHNELVKQRLSSIPVYISNEKEIETFPNEYILELDIQNDTESMMIVTTEDFKIKHIQTGKYMSQDEVRTIFPKNNLTQSYIDFIRLRPKISDSIPGEHISLTCQFVVSTAKVNGMYSVVSKCAYANTPNLQKIDDIWDKMRERLVSEEATKEEIEFEKKNFYLLDAQRQFEENSFDFVIQTIGQFDNKALIKKACIVLRNKFTDMIHGIDSDIVSITMSETTIENCYDITLENEDYTVGKVLEYILYEKYYIDEEIFSFCGFKKLHPHELDSKIRIAYKLPTDKHMLRQHLKTTCALAIDVFDKIYKMF